MISVKDSSSSFWLNLSPPLIPSSHKYYTNSSLMQGLVLTVSSCHGECVSLSCTWLSEFWILPIHLFYFFSIFRFPSHTYSVTTQCSQQLTPFCQISRVFKDQLCNFHFTFTASHSNDRWTFISLANCKFSSSRSNQLQTNLYFQPCFCSLFITYSLFRFGEQSIHFESAASEPSFSLF